MFKKAYNFVIYFEKALSDNSVGAYSAQAAFFVVISFSPFMLLMSREFSGVSLIPAIWAASHCMLAVIKGLNKVYSCESKRSWFKLRLISIAYMLILQLMFAVALVVLVLGDELNKYLMLNKAVVNMRWVIGFGLLILFLTFLYKFAPERKSRMKQCLPGAVLGAVGWVGFSGVFSLYVAEFADYDAVYGGLSAVVSSMLWLYFCMFILFAGAQFNVWLEGVKFE
ncbi:MAG: YihY/virulence factor BrkB family protein [Oscillospiraceae bacterium]|nr:YihY/virulence factor BrkB family protein [Oscillospiraceae bacterium]